MRHEDNLISIIYERVARENDNTEKELVHMIAEKVLSNSKINRVFNEAGIEAYDVKAENDRGEKIDKGAFVYCNNSLCDWTFERFDTIAGAVKRAVKMLNAYVMCNGEIIHYDMLDDKEAYYFSGDKMLLVQLED